MSLLLDTHAVLWWLADVELAPDVRQAIADPDRLVAVSAVSVWEIAVKRQSGKLEAPTGLLDAIAECGFELLAISGAHAERAGGLPGHHHDPFDRMLVAQAGAEGLVLVTRDEAFAPYDVPVLAC